MNYRDRLWRGAVNAGGGRHGLFDEEGNLNDFEPFQGDLPPDDPHISSGASRWGRRQLFHAQSANSFRDTQTLIQTEDIGRNTPILLQIRFALADAQGNAILPFSPAFPTSLAQVIVPVQIRRASDQFAPVLIDSYIFTQVGALGNTLPFDIIYTRNLGVEVTLDAHVLNVDTQLWIEAIATPVTQISQQDRIIAWQVSTTNQIGATASPVTLLNAHNDRAQFIITNTDSLGDLYVTFGAPATVGGASIVLPHGQFARYESPVGGYGGVVTGIWSPAPSGTGLALITEGTYH